MVATGLVAIATCCTPSAAALPKPQVSAPAAQLTTIDGAPLWSHNATATRPVASTIKLLNALVVVEHAALEETVTVSPRAAAIAEGDVGLSPRQKLTVSQLLDMMLVASANDAASALAIHVSGSERRHVARMNAKARQLGLTGTVARDPHGLGAQERSTARDLAILGRAALADPVLRTVVARRVVAIPRTGATLQWVPATNRLLGTYPGATGVKTGYTRPAGYCLVASARRHGVEIVGGRLRRAHAREPVHADEAALGLGLRAHARAHPRHE